MRAIVGAVILGLAAQAGATSISHGPEGNRSEAMPEPTPPSDETFSGTLQQVSKDQVNVSDALVKVQSGTPITLDGKPAQLGQLKPGQHVSVAYVLDKTGRRVAHALDAHSGVAPPAAPLPAPTPMK